MQFEGDPAEWATIPWRVYLEDRCPRPAFGGEDEAQSQFHRMASPRSFVGRRLLFSTSADGERQRYVDLREVISHGGQGTTFRCENFLPPFRFVLRVFLDTP
jgi:hypothetical protein